MEATKAEAACAVVPVIVNGEPPAALYARGEEDEDRRLRRVETGERHLHDRQIGGAGSIAVRLAAGIVERLALEAPVDAVAIDRPEAVGMNAGGVRRHRLE